MTIKDLTEMTLKFGLMCQKYVYYRSTACSRFHLTSFYQCFGSFTSHNYIHSKSLSKNQDAKLNKTTPFSSVTSSLALPLTMTSYLHSIHA